MFKHRKPQQPDQFFEPPRLEVELDGPKHPAGRRLENAYLYFPTSNITGRLTFRYQDPTVCDIENSTITLHGHSKVHLIRFNGQSTTHHRSRTPFLCVTYKLSSGPGGLMHPDGRGQTIPFQMTIPTHCSFDRSWPPGSADGLGHRSYYHIMEPSSEYPGNMANKPLPPTFAHNSRFVTQNFLAEVRYALTVQLAVRGVKECLSLRNDVAIILNQIAPDPSLLQNTRHLSHCQEVRTVRLLPENADRKLSWKEKMNGAFNAKSLPSISFTAIVAVPRAIALGRRPRFELQLKFNESNATASSSQLTDQAKPPLPEQIRLLRCSMVIRAITRGRAPRFVGDATDSSSDESTYPCQAVGTNDDILSKANEFRVLVESTRPLAGVVPGFETCNLRRNYFLKVEWELECAGETVRIVDTTLPLQIYAGVSAPVETPPTLGAEAPKQMKYPQDDKLQGYGKGAFSDDGAKLGEGSNEKSSAPLPPYVGSSSAAATLPAYSNTEGLSAAPTYEETTINQQTEPVVQDHSGHPYGKT